MGFEISSIKLIIKVLPFIITCIFCTCEDCYEDSNLVAPEYVTALYGSVEIVPFNSDPVYVGQTYYRHGASVIIYGGATVLNRFFLLKRIDQLGNSVNFFWNENNLPPFNLYASPPFHLPMEGEKINLYMVVFNVKQGDLSCIFKEAKSVESVLDVKVVVQDGEVIGEQRVVQKKYNIPAGNSAVFNYEFDYQGVGQYLINIDFTSEGIVETDTMDNNYSTSLRNLGLE